MIKVSLHPSMSNYMSRNDLEKHLSLANLMHLMPTDSGARRAFFRTIKSTEEDYNVSITVVKETNRDIIWEIREDRVRNIGSYMLIYYVARKGSLPIFVGSKPRIIEKARSATSKQLFQDVCAVLTDSLTNPGVNSYTFHLRVLEYMRQIADVIAERDIGGATSGENRESKSWYFFVDDKYRKDLAAIQKIYFKFGMRLTMREEL